MNALRVILASSSPRRSELLKKLVGEFLVVPSDAEEWHYDELTACELARANAWRKAESVAKAFPGALVLGADTLVYLDRCALGKPHDLPEARQMLQQLQGRKHHVVTGVCLLHCLSTRRRNFLELTEVTFRPLSPEQIDRYLGSINPLDKAGAYAIQEGGDALVQELSGSYSNVVGLPLERLRLELADWPVALLPQDL